MNTRKLNACLALGLLLAVGCDRGPGTAAIAPAVDGAPAPEFTGVSQWVNSPPLRLADLRGKVVVVHFWTNGCINCVRNYPHYKKWQDDRKANNSFALIGIHTPEFEGEKDVAVLEERMAKNGLNFPVAVDNDSANWKAWGNRYWPTIYLVDKTGRVRHKWEGELHGEGYRTVTSQIESLLAE